MKKRIVSLLLIAVMLVGMLPAIGITVGAASDPMSEGLSFSATDEYIVPYKLDVGATKTGKETMTVETEIYLPSSYATKRAGVVFGTYNGSSRHDFALEIESNGRVRIFTSKMGQIYFDDDGKRKVDGAQTTGNSKYDIFDYMADGSFVKIAVVINAADRTGTLYLNGVEQVTYPFCSDGGSVLKSWPDGYLTTLENFRLGGDFRDANSQYFKGSVKNIAIYSDARTASEVCTGINANDPNLLFGFDLTDPINPLSDLSMNKRHIVEPLAPEEPEEIKGMTFTADKLNEIPYKFDVQKPESGDEAITVEATLNISASTGDSIRAGIIVGNYTDDPNMNDCLNIELHKEGKVRVYMKHADDTYFSVDIRDYVGTNTTPLFVKLAVVINVTQKSASLYINGVHASTVALSKIVSGDLSLTEKLCVGGDLRSNNGTYFKGTIKNLAIYTDVRTSAEILADAKSFAPDAADEDLVCAYDFSQEDATSHNDLSGKGRDLIFKPREKSRTFTTEWKDAVSKAYPTAPKTMEATIYLPSNISERGGTILGNLDNELGSHTFHNYEIYTNGVPRLYYNTSKDTVTFWGVDVRKYNDWVHIAFVFDDSGETNILYLYINGELVASADKDDSGKALVDYDVRMNNTTYCVGMDFRAEANKPENARFKGYIKDIAVYTDIRSAAEIASDYANGVAINDEDIIAAYNFSGGVYFKDVSGNGYDLVTPEGMGMQFSQYEAYYTDGKFTQAPYTIETWLNLPADYNGNDRGGTIFGSFGRVGGTATYDSLNIEIEKNGHPRLCYYGTNNKWRTFVFNQVDVRSDEWVHLAIVADFANGKIECYLNGELKQTMTVDSKGSSVIAYNSVIPGTFCLGGDMRDPEDRAKYNSEYFKGTLLDLAVYSDVRTADEILASYKNGVDLNDEGLISYYDLSEVDDNAEIIYDTKKKNNVAATWELYPINDTSDYAYTFAVIGDTQKLVEQDYLNGTSYMQQIYKWIVDNQSKQNIQFVLGLGDITEDGHRKTDKGWGEWEIAKAQIPQLGAAGILYSLVPGNHENPQQLTTYFGDEASLVDNITGFYKTKEEAPDTWLGNYYMDFEVMGTKYTVFVFEYGANDNILSWAGEIIDSKPDRRVIITTHCYLYRDGTTLDLTDACPPDSTGNKTANNGDEMWEKFASQHANIFLVLSGHDPCENIVYRQDIGANGNLVTQFLVDPQGMDSKYGYQTGMVALFHFSADGKQLAVEYVSTIRDQYFKSVNQFELELFVPCDHTYDNDCDAICNKCYEARETKHNYEATIIAPTCTMGGETTYTCAICGDSYVADETDALGHTYDSDRDADCNVCGEVREVAVIGGTCGSSATWRYEDGVLYIEGTGSMNAFSSKNSPWIAYKDEITTVIVAEGIRSIGKCAFYEYTNLTSVILPSTLRTVNAYAFYGCSALTEITLPANLSSIKQYAFRRTGLVSVTMENKYGWSAGDMVIDSIEFAEENAAQLLKRTCFKLDWTRDTSVKPAESNMIAAGVCGTEVRWTLSRDGVLTIEGTGIMLEFTTYGTPWDAYKSQITKVVIGEGVTKVGKCSFYECAALTEVVLPSTLTEIGRYAFYGCKGLTEITVPEGVNTIGEYAFRKSGVTSVVFENAEGWTCKGASMDVTDATTAASLLKTNYTNAWTK